MKFECETKKLLAALRRVMPAVASSSAAKQRPVMACVRIVAQDDTVSVSGTDGTTWISAEVEAKCLQSGTVLVTADRLAATLGELGNETVTIATADALAILKCSIGRFEFPTHPVDQFPAQPDRDDGGEWFELPGLLLRSLIKRTTFACDRAESTKKFMTTGAVLERSGDTAVMVATDTKRLAWAAEPVSKSSGEITQVNEKPPIVPAKVLHAVDKAIEDGDAVTVRIRSNWVEFRGPKWTLFSGLLYGSFPPYRKLLDITPTVRVPLNTTAFAGALRRAAVMTDAESMRVDIEFKDKLATLRARGANTGSSDVTEPLPGFDGPETSIAFDPQYLIEWLKAIGDREVTVEIANPKKPAVIRAGDEAHYLVMPLTG